MPDDNDFTVDRISVQQYFYWSQVLFIFFVGALFFGLGLVLAPLYAFTLAPWLTSRQALALWYRLDGSTIRVDQGVFFLKRKAIPLDRVTDIVLSQGPLMRCFDLWALSIQTAGTGQQVAEAVLYGVKEPESVRDQLLRARDAAAQSARM